MYFRTDNCDDIYFPLPSACVTIKQYFLFLSAKPRLLRTSCVSRRWHVAARVKGYKGYNGHTRNPLTLWNAFVNVQWGIPGGFHGVPLGISTKQQQRNHFFIMLMRRTHPVRIHTRSLREQTGFCGLYR